ncbi:DNA alkylation repair protein [Streptacidiphilus anmyonensis]|uniref:DNA alkylation repair protein n=1 Tax=Streptacidiphilus anmyonensis TaxID=405782 RepID=UPI0005A7F108|nr:DNA alkylation repair protein [Streptacidiphilus anmyonensis]
MTANGAPSRTPADELRDQLRHLADPLRADQQRAYLHSDLSHLGVRVPDLRRCVTATRHRLGAVSAAQVLALAQELWSADGSAQPVYDHRRAVVEILVQYAPTLAAAQLEQVEAVLRQCSTWALVDPLAVHCAGAVLLRDPAAGAALDRWINDPDFWLRRSALLALLPAIRAGRPDIPRLARYCDALVDEREFFLRKALGWVLRETSTRDPQFVTDWLDRHGSRVAPLTRREALRRLPTGGPGTPPGTAAGTAAHP